MLDHEAGPAHDDLYGHMFYYVRDLCLKFHKRTRSLKLKITTLQVPFANLMNHLPVVEPGVKPQFDRIEVSMQSRTLHVYSLICSDEMQAADFIDVVPMVTAVMFGELLKHVDENPHATLLTISFNTVAHALEAILPILSEERDLVTHEAGTKLDELAPPISPATMHKKRDVARRIEGIAMWRNWDKFSEM